MAANNSKLEQAINSAFKFSDDPLKSKWWIKAIDALTSDEEGSSNSISSKFALEIVAVYNLQCVYESLYFDHSYDPLLWDTWLNIGFSSEALHRQLQVEGLSEQAASYSEENDEQHSAIRDALYKACWNRRQIIYDALLQATGSESGTIMLFLGEKVPRNRDAAERITSWVLNELENPW